MTLDRIKMIFKSTQTNSFRVLHDSAHDSRGIDTTRRRLLHVEALDSQRKGEDDAYRGRPPSRFGSRGRAARSAAGTRTPYGDDKAIEAGAARGASDR